MDSVAVANSETNHYQSFEMSGETPTIADLMRVTEEVDFPGPYTLIEELATYIPGEEFDSSSLDHTREVVVYDMYGPHGVNRPEPVFDFLVEVREWIDATLEQQSEGEYAIGQVIDMEDL